MNRKLRCIIVEDESIGIKLTGAFVKKIPDLECAGTFNDASAAMDYLQQHDADILITDIEMPGMNGLELAQSLSAPPAIIFLTAYREFAPEGFDIHAVDYLIKPVKFDRFEKAISRARDFLHAHTDNTGHHEQPSESLFVKEKNGYLKLLFSNIIYIEADGDYAHIHTTDNAKNIIRTTMAELEEKLPDSHFMRVHKSYIVNIHTIYFIHSTCIELNNKMEIPISRSYKPEVARRIGIKY